VDAPFDRHSEEPHDGSQAGEHGRQASRAVLGRGSLYTLGTAAPILAQAAVTPVVTRLLGRDAYGLVAQGVVVIQVTMMLASLGLPSVITRQALMTTNGMARARSILLRGSLTTLGFAAVAVAVTEVVLGGAAPVTRQTMLLAVASGACFVVVENAQALMRSLDRPLAFISISSVATLGGPLAGLAAILLLGRSAQNYLLGLLVGYALAALTGAVLSLGVRLSHRREHTPGDMREAYRLGLPMLPHMVALYLASMALVFVAGALYGRADSGRLQLALLIGTAPNVITSSLNNSWAPVVFAAPPERRAAVLERTATDVATVAALVAGGVALLSPWLLRLTADARFTPDLLVPAVCLACIGAMVSVAYLANVHLVFAQGRPAGLSLVTPVCLALGVATAWALGHLDLVWVAIGFPVTYAALAVGAAGLRRRVGGPAWKERRLARPFLLGSVFILCGFLLPVTGPWSASRWLVAAVAGVLVVQHGRQVLRPATPGA
jgi:O-antigen/teichoic acid export membrane protein